MGLQNLEQNLFIGPAFYRGGLSARIRGVFGCSWKVVMVSADQVKAGGSFYLQETKGVKVLETYVAPHYDGTTMCFSLINDKMDHKLVGVC